MSQIRKLKDGNKGIPKKTYQIVLDGQSYTIDDSQLTAINNQIANMSPRHRAYLGGVSNTISSGNFVGNRAENTVSLSALTNLSDRELNTLKERKSSRWETLTDSDTYRAKEAINHLLHIVAGTINSSKADTSDSKSKVEKSTIVLDFNDKDGKKVLSPTAETNFNAKKRVSDLIGHLKVGDTSEYDYSNYNTDAISSWLNGLEGDDKHEAGNKYFTDLWTAMGKPGYQYDPDVEDLLNLFGINYNMAKPSAGDTGTGTVTETGAASGINNGSGDVTKPESGIDSDIVNGNEESEQNLGTSTNANLPTLITPELAKSMNLGNEYLFGVIDVNGEKYTPEQIKTNRPLSELMQYVESINKQNIPQSERYKLISERLNIPTIENYTDWLPGTTVKGIDLDSIFKSQNVSSAAISKQNLEGFDDYTVFKYFNNGEVGTNPWGFRSPYYLVIGNDGRLHVQTNEPHIEAIYGSKPTTDGAPTLVESNWNPEDIFVDKWTGTTHWSPNWGVYNVPASASEQRKLRLSEIGKVVLPFNNVTQRIMRDINDVWYAVGSDGKTRQINKEYAKKILQGSEITRSEWHNNISNSYKQGGTISKSKIDFFKQNFIVKEQSGGTINPNWKVPGWNLEMTTPSWKQGSLYPQGTEPRIGFTTNTPGVLGMSDRDVTGGIWVGDVLTGRKTAKDNALTYNNNKSRKIDDGGGYPEATPDYTRYLIPAISAARFGINAALQKKYRDTAKKGIEAARFSEQPVTLNTPRNDNPALDRALQQVQSERMAGIKPVTSDLIANNALSNQREAQLYDREKAIVTQRSQSDWEAKKEALNIMNQNIANQTTTANQNRARNASINSALYNPELEFIQRRGQSIENLGLEIQSNIKQDRNIMLNYAKQKEIERQGDIFNRHLDEIFPGGRAAYNALSVDEKAKYVDLEDYLRRKYPQEWSDNAEQIAAWQRASNDDLLYWMYQNGLNYSYPSWLIGRTPDIYKKGGRLNGTTRYTLNPDERIWVDNNKATHQAIAKLSDNTIKLLLRALK